VPIPRAGRAAFFRYSGRVVKDAIILGGLVLGFATLVTVHVALAFRLTLRERPRWRGPVALVVPPLAVIWAFKAGWRRTAILWLAAVLIYAIALVVALWSR
jgi:hypothetical protein